MPTIKQNQRKRNLGIEFALFISYTAPLGIALLHASLKDSALAQLIPDTTLGSESSTVTATSLTVEQINGGAPRGANLFHSFQEFNVGVGRGVYFSNPAGIENILTRVTGTNPSNILGKLGVLGNANLFLLNPNGIIFGSGASLDINGSFVASTANAFTFADGTFFSATNPQAQPLLTINVPIGLQFGTNQPAAIINAGTLAVKPEQNLGLIGGTVVSTGQMNAPGGQLLVATVSGSEMDAVPSSSLSELLAVAGDETGLTVNSSGGVELSGSGIPVENGDVTVRQLNAETATLSSAHNLTLVPVDGQEGFEGGVSLQTSGNMNLLARDTVRIRDSVEQPFLAQAGRNLYIQGNQSIDILALNHLDKATPFQSGGSLSLVSDGVISGDAHFASNGKFEILNLSGGSANFVSLYDPIISSNSDVYLGDYTGASLKVESRGSITAGNITITTPDTTLSGTDPDIAILTSSPALILRANVSELQNPVSAPIVNAGETAIRSFSYNITNLGTFPGGSSSSPNHMNNSGQVVGNADSAGNNHAFLYNGSGLLQDLGFLPGGGSSAAYGINNSGTVVGGSDSPNGQRPFLYNGSGSLQNLGLLPGHGWGWARKINDSGTVVGVSYLNLSDRRLFLYNGSGTLQDLGTLPGGNYSENGYINNLGQVVGTSGSSNGARAFLYNGSGALQDLGTLPGDSYSRASDINDLGQVVGASGNSNGARVFLYSGGQMRDLGNLPGDTYSRPTDINNSGQVVGVSAPSPLPIGGAFTYSNSGQRAFLYSNGVMNDLNDLIPTSPGWTLTHAQAINDSGQIAGEGYFEGRIVGFRADPFATRTSGITVGNISTAGGPVILQGPIINLTGSSIASNGGYMSFDGPVVLNNNISANSSGGNISFNNTVDGLQNLTLNADTGNVTFNGAVGETIKLGNLTIGSAGSVNTGAISATGIDITATGAITSTGKLDTSSIFDDGGAISLNAGSNITTGTISSESVSGTGGNINLTSSDGQIDTTSGDLKSSSIGNAGGINLEADGNITTGNIYSYSYAYDRSTGGSISLTSNNGTIDTTRGDLNSSSFSGNAGAINLEADGNITSGFITAVGGNSGGDLTITSNAQFSSASTLILTGTLGAGNGGDIDIQARSVALTDGTRVAASTRGAGRAGNITVRALESVELSSTNDRRNFISTDTGGSGDAGNVVVETGQLIIQDGSGISATAGFDRTGRGGNVTVNASDSVEVSGTTLDNRPSVLATGTGGIGRAGDLTINTRRLVIRDGAAVLTSTISPVSEGVGGNLTVNASESVELSGTSADGQIPSPLSTDTGGSAKAGDLTINTRRFIARDGAVASVSSFDQGRSGSLTLNASESVELSGTSASGFASGLYAQAFASGNAGFLTIRTRDLRVQDGANVTVASRSLSDTRFPRARTEIDFGDGVRFSLPTDTIATGDAGTLKVEADTIFLNRQGSLIASTASGEGGNIDLKAQNSILMRHNSLISAEAGNNGNGGNITINTPFVIGFKQENSDIIANAFQGRGGNIYITVEGIYGLKFRPRLTPFSDITASSEVEGQDGIVEINTPTVDPTQGLANLPTDFEEPPMEDSCRASTQTASTFTNTGRGGFPPSPDDFLSSDPDLVELVTPVQGRQNPSRPVGAANSDSPTPNTIVEAQGWIVTADGTVTLTAQAPRVTPYTPAFTSANCQAHRGGAGG